MYGKRKLTSILSRELGYPYRHVATYGKYSRYGNVERLALGSRTLIANADGVTLIYPTWPDDEDIKYKKKIIERR